MPEISLTYPSAADVGVWLTRFAHDFASAAVCPSDSRFYSTIVWTIFFAFAVVDVGQSGRLAAVLLLKRFVFGQKTLPLDARTHIYGVCWLTDVDWTSRSMSVSRKLHAQLIPMEQTVRVHKPVAPLTCYKMETAIASCGAHSVFVRQRVFRCSDGYDLIDLMTKLFITEGVSASELLEMHRVCSQKSQESARATKSHHHGAKKETKGRKEEEEKGKKKKEEKGEKNHKEKEVIEERKEKKEKKRHGSEEVVKEIPAEEKKEKKQKEAKKKKKEKGKNENEWREEEEREEKEGRKKGRNENEWREEEEKKGRKKDERRKEDNDRAEPNDPSKNEGLDLLRNSNRNPRQRAKFADENADDAARVSNADPDLVVDAFLPRRVLKRLVDGIESDLWPGRRDSDRSPSKTGAANNNKANNTGALLRVPSPIVVEGGARISQRRGNNEGVRKSVEGGNEDGALKEIRRCVGRSREGRDDDHEDDVAEREKKKRNEEENERRKWKEMRRKEEERMNEARKRRSAGRNSGGDSPDRRVDPPPPRRRRNRLVVGDCATPETSSSSSSSSSSSATLAAKKADDDDDTFVDSVGNILKNDRNARPLRNNNNKEAKGTLFYDPDASSLICNGALSSSSSCSSSRSDSPNRRLAKSFKASTATPVVQANQAGAVTGKRAGQQAGRLSFMSLD